MEIYNKILSYKALFFFSKINFENWKIDNIFIFFNDIVSYIVEFVPAAININMKK